MMMGITSGQSCSSFCLTRSTLTMLACEKLPCTYSGEPLFTSSKIFYWGFIVIASEQSDYLYVQTGAPVADRCVSWPFFRNFPGIFGNQQQHYMEVIKRMLVQCMQDQANPQVRSHKSSFLAVHFLIYVTVHYNFLPSYYPSDSYPGGSSCSVLCSVKWKQHSTAEAFRWPAPWHPAGKIQDPCV